MIFNEWYYIVKIDFVFDLCFLKGWFWSLPNRSRVLGRELEEYIKLWSNWERGGLKMRIRDIIYVFF